MTNEELDALQARIAALEGERDRQYDYNCEAIKQIAALQAALATARADAIREAAIKTDLLARLTSGHQSVEHFGDTPAPDPVAQASRVDVKVLTEAIWNEYLDSRENRWVFRKEHIENAALRALAGEGKA